MAPAPGPQPEEIHDREHGRIGIRPNEPWSWLELSLDFQNSLVRKLPNLRIHYDFRVVQPWVQTRYLPMINLVSLKLPDPYPFTLQMVRRWQQVILGSPNLETLRCYPEYTFSLNSHQRKDNFPAIRELTPESADGLDIHGGFINWDFSNLSVLNLFEVHLESFFTVLPFEKLSGLRELRVELWGISHPTPRAVSWVDKYLVPCIKAIVRLEVLDIKCARPHKLLPALEKHRRSLKVLRLTQCMASRDLRVIAEDIEGLRTMFSFLDELVLDIKVVGDAEIEEQREET
jgi:hypothetical protein